MANRLICLCNLIDKKEIMNCLKKGASNTKDIQNFTRAGTVCGRCLPEIDALVEDFQTAKSKNPQNKLGFKF